ncbi:hypothetical protein [Streptomyces sp. NPDC048361]|uniref:hypothetical protein n=1 Tax=Streptomyces sp. NPDC048361 TaxID=3154720 RepID=UPI00341E972C
MFSTDPCRHRDDDDVHPPCEGNDQTLAEHLAFPYESGLERAGTVRYFGHSHVVVDVDVAVR